MIRQLLWRTAWFLYPACIGWVVRRLTGCTFGRVEHEDGTFKFYFQKERPAEFSEDAWPDVS